MRTTIFAALLSLASSLAYGQAPPPVPPLPDTDRVTVYTITNSTCACAVGFAFYGDGTDYQNWLQVTLNGFSAVNFTITSPSGPIGNIARPITDAILTFNHSVTGTVQITGARRPRRLKQFSENQTIATRDLNQILTDITAMHRELWNKLHAFAPP